MNPEAEAIKLEVMELMKSEIESCQRDMYSEIKAMKIAIDAQDKIRAEMKETLNANLKQSKDNHAKFEEHALEEMEKYKQMVDAIEDLTKTMKDLISKTEYNSAYVDSQKYNDELEKRVAQHLADIDAPKQEMIHKVKMTAIGVATVATMGVMGSAVKFLYDLSTAMNIGVN